MAALYSITEFGSFVADKNVPGYQSLPKHIFDQLENFILTKQNKQTDASEIMGISVRKGVGKIITAKNYVGVVTMRDGTIIEILPKIYSQTFDAADESGNIAAVRKILVEMLKTLYQPFFKSLQTAYVNVANINILEVFIRMYIDEVFRIVKHGLKCDYEPVLQNDSIIKGKLKFSEHIKRNYAHKELNFVEVDHYSPNRPENRLIKTTLQYLYRQSASIRNKRDIKTLLNEFSEVSLSENFETDFSKCVPDRNMKDYEFALQWSRVFLRGKSFTSFSGSEIAAALLFPMETLFERYIAVKLFQILGGEEFQFFTQDTRHYLFDEPSKKFLMRPDIVMIRKGDGKTFVADTKWKALSETRSNYGISQADMYQMFAYQKKYGAENITLIYPLTQQVPSNRDIQYKSHDGVTVRVKFVDLSDVQGSLAKIAEDFKGEKATADSFVY